jgi:hypothetical protein
MKKTEEHKVESKYNYAEACNLLQVGGISRQVVFAKYFREKWTLDTWKKKFQKDKIIK